MIRIIFKSTFFDIPGVSTAERAIQNAASTHAVISSGFWDDLMREKLIAAHAPVPEH